MTVEQLLSILARRWRAVIASAAVGLLLACLFAALMPSKSRASITFFVLGSITAGSDAASSAQYAQDRVNSYTSLLSSDRVARDASDALGGSPSSDAILDSLNVSAEPDSVVITVTASAESPQVAIQIGNAIGQVFPGLVRELETPNQPSARPAVDVQIVQPATTIASSATRTIVAYAIGGILAGIAVGCSLALVRDRIDNKVRSEDWLTRNTGFSSLGAVPHTARASSVSLGSASAPASLREAYRQIRTSLAFTSFEAGKSVTLVTSAIEGEGKSTTALNLAYVFSAAGSSVLLIEADLRRPTLAERVRVLGEVGLSNTVVGQVNANEAIQKLDQNLDVLVAGKRPPNPSELLASHRMTQLLEFLKRQYDVVIVDTPPVLPVSDARELFAKVDRVVLVARQGYSRTGAILKMQALLTEAPTPLSGYILNDVTGKSEHSGYASYYGTPPVSESMSSVDEARTIAILPSRTADQHRRAEKARKHGREEA